MRTITDSALVWITSPPAEPFVAEFGEFLDANELAADDVAAIRADLAAEGEHRGGGGAMPVWTLTLVDI